MSTSKKTAKISKKTTPKKRAPKAPVGNPTILKSSDVPRFGHNLIATLRKKRSELLLHIGGAFLVRAGLELVLSDLGGMENRSGRIEHVDLINIGAAVLAMTDSQDAFDLIELADSEVRRGRRPGQVTRDGSPYLFADRFPRLSRAPLS